VIPTSLWMSKRGYPPVIVMFVIIGVAAWAVMTRQNAKALTPILPMRVFMVFAA
jgi:hypothetical protein